MTTYFDTHKMYWDVPVTEEGVDTVSFLEASEAVVQIFELLNSKAFTVVQADLTGNITKLRNYYNAHKAESGTLESLVISEKTQKKRLATEGLMWLLRGLQFTHEGLQQSLNNKSEELSVSFTKAYDVTLKPYHTFVVRPMITLAMKACPYRKDFYSKLGFPAEDVDEKLQKNLTALGDIIKRMQAFYEAGGYNKGL